MNLLRNIEFLKLWTNQILLQIAFNATTFTALLLIDQLTLSRFALSQYYAAITIPSFIIGLLAGAVIDIVDRKRLMLITDALLVGLFVLYAFYTHNYWAILIISFITAIVAQFFTPAEAATIPYVVKKEQLETANTFFLFTGLATVLAGYALSGPVIQIFGGLNHYGDQAVFVFSSAVTAIGFLLLASLKRITTLKPRVGEEEFVNKTTLLTRQVLFETKNNPKIAIPVAFLTLLQFNLGLLFILSIEFVRRYLLLPTTSASFILIIPLIFGLPGGFLLMRALHARWGRGKTIFAGTALLGTVLAILGASGEIFYKDIYLIRGLTAVAACLIGVSAVLIAVHSRTSLQESTPKHMLGRVFALVTVTGSAVTPIPLLLLAFITEKIETTWVFLFVGIATLLIAVLTKRTLATKL